MRVGVAAACVSACWLAVASARAQSADSAEASRLLQEARRLGGEGRWVDACPLLHESLRLQPSMTTQFRLAACYEQTGRTSSAWMLYDAVANAASRAGEKEKAQFARERATRLAPNADRILIVPPVGDVHVDYDGREVPRSQWPSPLPLDPGEHTVHVWAPRMFSFDTVVAGTSEGRVVRLLVPALEPAPLEPGATKALPPPPAPTTPDTKPRPNSVLKPLGLGLGIGGMALLGGGTALFMESRIDKSASGCNTACVGGIGMLSLGGAALVFGTIVFILGLQER
jgi:hypothetical protein